MVVYLFIYFYQDPDTKGSSRPWTSLRSIKEKKNEEEKKPKYGVTFDYSNEIENYTNIRHGRIIKMPNNIWDSLSKPKQPSKSIKLRTTSYTNKKFENPFPVYTKVYNKIDDIMKDPDGYKKLNNKVKELSEKPKTDIIERNIKDANDNIYHPTKIIRKRYLLI